MPLDLARVLGLSLVSEYVRNISEFSNKPQDYA